MVHLVPASLARTANYLAGYSDEPEPWARIGRFVHRPTLESTKQTDPLRWHEVGCGCPAPAGMLPLRKYAQASSLAECWFALGNTASPVMFAPCATLEARACGIWLRAVDHLEPNIELVRRLAPLHQLVEGLRAPRASEYYPEGLTGYLDDRYSGLFLGAAHRDLLDELADLLAPQLRALSTSQLVGTLAQMFADTRTALVERWLSQTAPPRPLAGRDEELVLCYAGRTRRVVASLELVRLAASESAQPAPGTLLAVVPRCVAAILQADERCAYVELPEDWSPALLELSAALISSEEARLHEEQGFPVDPASAEDRWERALERSVELARAGLTLA